MIHALQASLLISLYLAEIGKNMFYSGITQCISRGFPKNKSGDHHLLEDFTKKHIFLLFFAQGSQGF